MAAKGQIIVLSGVTSAAPASAPKIEMNAADLVAVKIASLKHVVSAKALTPLPAGGVSGRCRATGQALVPKGTISALEVSTIGGKKGLGIGSSGTAVAGLALPAGSFPASYTAVMAINVGALSMANSGATNFLSAFDSPDTWTAQMLRYNGSGASGTAENKFATRGNNTAGIVIESVRIAGNWNIVVVDYNNATRLASLGVNVTGGFATITSPAARTPAPTEYLELGYHLSNSSLKDSKVGDLYLFDTSLASTSAGLIQLADLVAAMKADYGVA